MVYAAVMWSALTVQRYFWPPGFLLPNGLTVQMPFHDMRTADIVDASGRVIRHHSEWVCFDDRTVWLTGDSGTISLDAVEGRIVGERRGGAADDASCDDGYFPGNSGISLFFHDDWRFPCDHLNPDLDRFAQARRFRDLCRTSGTPTAPAR